MGDIQKIFPQYSELCEAWLKAIYPKAGFPTTGGASTTAETNYHLAVSETTKCIIDSHVKANKYCASRPEQIDAAIALREKVEGIFKKVKPLERNGYPVYDTATISRMESGLERLYFRLLNLCSAPLFNEIAERIVNAHNNTKAGGIGLIDIVRKMERIENGYRDDPHLRYLKGDERWAAELMLAVGLDRKNMIIYFPIQP